MLSTVSSYQRWLSQMRSTPASPFLDGFVAMLTKAGYQPRTIRGFVRGAAHFGLWNDLYADDRVPVRAGFHQLVQVGDLLQTIHLTNFGERVSDVCPVRSCAPMTHLTYSPKCLTDQVRGHTFLPNCLNRTGKVIDLGMNKGEFAEEMRDRYGCSVSGIEANPSLADAISNLTDIPCKNAVISGSDGSVEFFINPTNSEASKIVTFRSVDTLVMPCVSLSTFFREVEADEVDLLKVDIEGAELDLIEKTDPPDLLRCAQITIEFHAFCFPEQTPRVEIAIAKLSEMGFYHLDFSIRRTDVLFINNRMIELSAADKLYLGFQKYRSGVKRRLSRLG